MTTTDNSCADALTDHLYILSVNEESMEEAIERFDGSSTGEALKCVLHAQKQLRALLVTPVEQHEAAPAEPEPPLSVGDRLTRKKAAHIIARDGFYATGYVLGGGMADGRRCIVEMGAVRWLTTGEAWKLMHPDAQPAPSAPLEGTGNGAKLELASDGRALYERLHTLMPEWYPDAWGDLLPKYQSAYAEAARAPRTEVAGAVPEGWKLVPVEPTEGMKSAALRADDRWRQPGDQLLVQWDAMLAAAPPSPSADAAAEDKYVIERLSTVLAGVAAALLGEEADRPAAETLQKLPEEAAKLRLELDLYRAQAADAAAAPTDWQRALPQIPDLVKSMAWLTMCLRTELSRLDDTTHKALDEVEAQLCCVRAITNGAIDYEDMVAARSAASRSAAAAGQEAPVPYGYEFLDMAGKNHFVRGSLPDYAQSEILALYTAAPAQVATRQGLTDGQRGVLTYVNQPDNVGAWRLGEACRAARAGGDPIDHGLSLLKELQDRGYGVIALLEGAKLPNHGEQA
jgi:hypothetical protein